MRRITDVRCRAQTGAQESHQQRRRHALAGHVGDDDADLIFEETRPVIVVAGNFFGRKVVSADIKAFELRISRRQQLQLHLPGDLELSFEPLLLDRLLVQHNFLDDDGHLR